MDQNTLVMQLARPFDRRRLGRTAIILGVVLAVPVAGALTSGDAYADQPNVEQVGPMSRITLPAQARQGGIGSGFENAKPLDLPMSDRAPIRPHDVFQNTGAQLLGEPKSIPGGRGTGKEQLVTLFEAKDLKQEVTDDGIRPQAYGTAKHPFTTARVNTGAALTSKQGWYRAAGKLFIDLDSDLIYDGWCSASLIKRGVVVTAAHCVAEFGVAPFGNWAFVPAYDNGAAPFGVYGWQQAWVLTSYLDGTDSCAVPGIVCQNDVAVITLAPSGGRYPGSLTGWYGYGVNGYGYTPANIAQLEQLGYPASLDSGELEQRNDSFGFVDIGMSNNTVIGSLMTAGSSGGPWLVNFGNAPVLSGGVLPGAEATRNIVVNVTSWGYTNQQIKEQGASPFTSANIGVLVPAACESIPGAC